MLKCICIYIWCAERDSNPQPDRYAYHYSFRYSVI